MAILHRAASFYSQAVFDYINYTQITCSRKKNIKKWKRNPAPSIHLLIFSTDLEQILMVVENRNCKFSFVETFFMILNAYIAVITSSLEHILQYVLAKKNILTKTSYNQANYMHYNHWLSQPSYACKWL